MKKRALSFLEQAIVSGTNFIILLILARELPKDIWGIYSMGYAMLLFAQGFQRAYMILPFVTMTRSEDELLETTHFWVKLQWMITILSIVALLILGVLADTIGLEWLASSFWVASMLVLPYFMHEFVRRYLLQRQQMKQVIGIAVLYSAAMATSLLIALLITESPVMIALALCVIGGMTMIAFVCMFDGKRQRTSISEIRRDVIKFGKWSAMAHSAYAGYTTAIQLMLGVISGPAAVGVFSALRNFIQPINVLIGAVDNLDKPKAVREYHHHGKSGMLGSLKRTLQLLLTVGGAYILIISISAEWLVDLLYANKYSGHYVDTMLWCAVAVMMLIAQPMETGLYVIQQPKAIFINRCISMLLALSAAIVLIPVNGVTGAIIATLLGWLASAVLAVYRLYSPTLFSTN